MWLRFVIALLALSTALANCSFGESTDCTTPGIDSPGWPIDPELHTTGRPLLVWHLCTGKSFVFRGIRSAGG